MLLKNLGKIIGGLLLAVAPVNAQTNVIQFQSAPERTALLELYTSEGCSSCPPAEEWFSGLQNSPRLWKDFAPVAFHVDYWDALGWKDAWAAEEYSERQRAYGQLWHSENIYTPEYVLNGREWRGWFTGKSGPKSSGERVGVLTVVSADTNHWQVSFVPEKIADYHYQVHAALLAGGIVSDVKVGENRGRRLNHDFAAVQLLQTGMTSGNGIVRGKFPLNPAGFKSGKTSALVVWVTKAGEFQSLQATGGWLASPPDNNGKK